MIESFTFSMTSILNIIRGFKIQFYIFLIFTLALMVFRVVRAKYGKIYSKKIILYPLIYLLLTLYSSVTLTLPQFEFSAGVYVFGIIIGFIIGDLSELYIRNGIDSYQSSGGVAVAWSFLFLVKWYAYLYQPTFPPLVDPIITISFTFLAGIILGQAMGIMFKHWRT